MTVKQHFKTSSVLPELIDPKDVNKIMNLGEYSENSMLLTLIIPFCFMVFMSVSMDSVWSMYLMLQIVTNITHLKLNIPGNVRYVLFILQKISYFKITEEQNF